MLIVGQIEGFRFNNRGDKEKLINITSWGPLKLGNLGGYFYGASSLANITDTPNLTGTTSLRNMFRLAGKFNGNISSWNTSSVTDMNSMFSNASSFNQPLNNWSTSSVTSMQSMFSNATSFNQPLNNWSTSSVTDMNSMFSSATSFNQPLNKWDVSSATDMYAMFSNATKFNRPLNSWKTGSVTDMYAMFSHASSFNQSLNSWNTSSVTDMSSMFSNASRFDQPLNNWDTSSVDDMRSMFSNATKFNQNLTGWDVCQVISYADFDSGAVSWDLNNKPRFGAPCKYYFESEWDTTKTSSGSSGSSEITLPLYNGGKYNFTVDWGDGNKTNVTSWDSSNKTHTYSSSGNYTLNITGQIEGFRFNNQGDRDKIIRITSWGPLKLGNLSGYFYGASNLESIKGRPDLSGTGNLSNMFRLAGKFNSNINKWDVSSATDMKGMFSNATSFNQPLNKWNVFLVEDMQGMFSNASRFNQPLNNWNTGSVKKMDLMFSNASSFNQDLTEWNVCRVSSYDDFDAGASSWNSNYKPVFGQACKTPFLSVWDTTKTSSGSSSSKQIRLPLYNGGKYNFTVDWGDGNVSKVTSYNSANRTHTYDNSGTYTVKITGQIEGFRFNNAGDRNKLINITNWGPLNLGNLGGYFYGASNLVEILGKPNLTGTTNFQNMFRSAAKFNGSISGWDVSSVTNMNSMFYYATSFNQPLNNWDVSSVTSMYYMFGYASIFNQNLSGWNVCRVSSRSYFSYAANAWNLGYQPRFNHICENGLPLTNYFESTWDTTGRTTGNNKEIYLPLYSGGKYNFTVYWGDNTSNRVTRWNSGRSHTYSKAGNYTIRIYGQIEGFNFKPRGIQK